MSQYYMADGVVVWNPSSGASRLFLGQVRLVEAEFHLASGIGLMESDECDIDVAVFDVFARTLAREPTLRMHQPIRALADGVVVTLLALAHHLDLVQSWQQPVDDLEASLRERGRRLERSLTR